MSQLIELNNGEYVSLLCFEDALETVEEVGGRGLRDFIEEYMWDNMDESVVDRLEAEVEKGDDKTLEERYEQALLLVQSGLDTLQERINDDQLDKEDLQKLVNAISGTVEDVL